MSTSAVEYDGRFRAPFPGQQEKFFHRTEHFVFYGGAGGGGKSMCGMAKFGQQLAVERSRFLEGKITKSRAWGLYLRRTMPDLQQAIDRSEQLFTDIDPDAEYNVNDHIWTFPSCGDAKFQFGHMENESSKYKYKSSEYTYVFFDELTEFSETQFDYMDTRLRTTDPELRDMLQVCAASNPDGPGLLWVRDRFIEDKEPEVVYRKPTVLSDGRVINYDQIFIPAKLSDNPVLYQMGTYEASLLNKRPEVREAILNGNWWITPGAFLANVWDSRYHVVPNHDVPKGAKVFRSGDIGIRSPTSITWWYVDRDDVLTGIVNLYVRDHDVPMIAARMREIEEFYGWWDDESNLSKLNGPLDQSCFRREMTGPTINELFWRHGFRWHRATKDRFNSTAEMIRRMNARVKPPSEEHDAKAMLRWMERCAAPIKTIPVLRVDPNDANDVDTKGEDHAWDETRYMCAARPMAHPEPKDSDDYPDPIDLIDEREKRRAVGSGRLGTPPGGW